MADLSRRTFFRLLPTVPLALVPALAQAKPEPLPQFHNYEVLLAEDLNQIVSAVEALRRG